MHHQAARNTDFLSGKWPRAYPFSKGPETSTDVTTLQVGQLRLEPPEAKTQVKENRVLDPARHADQTRRVSLLLLQKILRGQSGCFGD